jgi:hypothetical protein
MEYNRAACIMVDFGEELLYCEPRGLEGAHQVKHIPARFSKETRASARMNPILAEEALAAMEQEDGGDEEEVLEGYAGGEEDASGEDESAALALQFQESLKIKDLTGGHLTASEELREAKLEGGLQERHRNGRLERLPRPVYPHVKGELRQVDPTLCSLRNRKDGLQVLELFAGLGTGVAALVMAGYKIRK